MGAETVGDMPVTHKIGYWQRRMLQEDADVGGPSGVT